MLTRYVLPQLRPETLDSVTIDKRVRQITSTPDQVNKLLLSVSFILNKNEAEETLFNDICRALKQSLRFFNSAGGRPEKVDGERGTEE